MQERCADVVHRREQARCLLLGTDHAPHHGTHLAQVELLGKEVHRRHRHRREEAVDGARGRGPELAVKAHDLRGLLDRPEGRPGHDRSADRVRAELERRDNAEVAAATAQRPEQLGVLAVTRVHLRPIGEHHVGADQAVDSQAEAPRQVPEPAAQREPTHPGRRDDPRRGGATVLGGRPVDVAPRAASADADAVGVRVDDHLGHAGQVDDDPVVDDAQAASVVPAAAHREWRFVGTRERDAACDIVGARAAHEEGGTSVDHAVVDGSRIVVARITSADDAVIQIGEVAAGDLGEGRGDAHKTLLVSWPAGDSSRRRNVRHAWRAVMTWSDRIFEVF